MPKYYKRYNAIYFFIFVAMGSFLAYYATYLSDIGLTTSQVGTIFGSVSLTTLFAQPFWTFVSRKVRNHKVLICINMVAMMVCYGMMLLAVGFEMILMVLIVLNFFQAPLFSLLDGQVTTYAFKNDVQYKNIRSLGSVGFAAASGVIGIAYANLGFASNIILSISAFVIAMLIIMTVDMSEDSYHEEVKESISGIVKNKKYMFFLLLTLFCGLTNMVSSNFFGAYIVENAYNTIHVGFINTVMVFCEVMTMIFVVGFVRRRMGNFSIILLAYVFFTVRWFFYGFVDMNVTLLYLSTAIFGGLGSGLTIAVMFDTLREIIGTSEIKLTIFVNTILMSVASAGMSRLYGQIADVVSLDTIFRISAMVMSIGLVYGFILNRTVFIERKNINIHLKGEANG